MDELLNPMPFETWLRLIFDTKVKLDSCFDISREDVGLGALEKNSALLVSYFSRRFENCAELLASYSNLQIACGIQFIVNNSFSNHMFALLDEGVTWAERQRCIESFYEVYARIFAPKCAPFLSAFIEPEPEARDNPLNSICYMWWDIIPIAGQPAEANRRQFDKAILHVMEKTLTLPSDACREGALHGLGHWKMYYPGRVQHIIDQFLANNSDLRPEMREYALLAREGQIM